MASWTLVPCLVALRRDLDLLAPGRDKSSDGAIGDTAHSAGGNSDHLPDEQFSALRGKDADSLNEVHAIDVDQDGPWPAGWSMNRIVQTIVLRHRSGQDDRLQNVIYNAKIYSRSWGWTARAYTGSNAHRHHAHFSARYDSRAEADTRPWLGPIPKPSPAKPTVEEFVMATKAEVKAALIEALSEAQPYATPAGQRFKAGGWSDLSMRGLLEYTLEAARGAGGAAAFQQEVREALAKIAADPGNSVVLSSEQLDELAGRLPAEIAKAVNDDAARRLSS